MTNITYGVVDETYVLDGVKRHSYGIVGYADANTEGTATIVVSARDVSVDKQRVSDLVELCNRLAISDAHLYDVIEDFLAE